MKNEIYLDKKATEIVRKVVGGGGGGNGSDYVATYDQFNNAFKYVSFDGTKIVQMLKNYGVDMSMTMYKDDVGEFSYMLVKNPKTSVDNVYNNLDNVIIGYDYYGYNFYNNFNNPVEVPVEQDITFEELLLNYFGYQMFTTTYIFSANTIVFSCMYGPEIQFKTAIKIQDLIDCIAE